MTLGKSTIRTQETDVRIREFKCGLGNGFSPPSWVQDCRGCRSRSSAGGDARLQGQSSYRYLFSKFVWYEVENFARRDKIFCDVFSIHHELSAHNSEQAFLIRVEHA